MEMNNTHWKYSLKNIRFPGKHKFILFLTDKIMEFIKRMWWKTHFYLLSLTTGAETNREEVEFTEDTTQQP